MALDAGRIQKSVRKLRRLLKTIPKRPSPDEIHDLRTHIRRLEAALEALALNSRRNERRLLLDLGRLRRRAGKIRDMDVFTAHTSTVHVDQEQDCLVQLLEYLGAERYRHAEKLHARIRKYRAPLRRRLKRTSMLLEKIIPVEGEHLAREHNTAPIDATASALKLSSKLGTPATLNRKNLHAYRLKTKELLYVLQMSEDAGNREFVDPLREIKDAIGEWHDWEELVAIARNELDHTRNCKLLSELKTISGRKYESALSLTNKMRKEYVRSSDRMNKRVSAATHRPAQPVLEVTSAIAS